MDIYKAKNILIKPLPNGRYKMLIDGVDFSFISEAT